MGLLVSGLRARRYGLFFARQKAGAAVADRVDIALAFDLEGRVDVKLKAPVLLQVRPRSRKKSGPAHTSAPHLDLGVDRLAAFGQDLIFGRFDDLFAGEHLDTEFFELLTGGVL